MTRDKTPQSAPDGVYGDCGISPGPDRYKVDLRCFIGWLKSHCGATEERAWDIPSTIATPRSRASRKWRRRHNAHAHRKWTATDVTRRHRGDDRLVNCRQQHPGRRIQPHHLWVSASDTRPRGIVPPRGILYPHPVVSLLPPGLPPRTFAWTVSSELLGFWFYFFPYFSFLGRALD